MSTRRSARRSQIVGVVTALAAAALLFGTPFFDEAQRVGEALQASALAAAADS